MNSWVHTERRRGDRHKLLQGKFRLDKRKIFFTVHQDIQRACGISILQNIQYLTTHDPKTPSLSSQQAMIFRSPFKTKLLQVPMLLRQNFPSSSMIVECPFLKDMEGLLEIPVNSINKITQNVILISPIRELQQDYK